MTVCPKCVPCRACEGRGWIVAAFLDDEGQICDNCNNTGVEEECDEHRAAAEEETFGEEPEKLSETDMEKIEEDDRRWQEIENRINEL